MEHCSSPLCDRQTWGPLAFITGCHACQCPVCMCAKLFQLSCPALCDPMDRSPPGSSVHGILQARILEWVAMHSSRGFSQPRHPTCISYVSCIGRQVLTLLGKKGLCRYNQSYYSVTLRNRD